MHSVMCVKSRIAKDSERAALQETLDAVASKRFRLERTSGIRRLSRSFLQGVKIYSDSREYAL